MPTADFTITTEELALFMRTRSKTRWGAVVGEFNADTPVTAEHATSLIREAVREVAISVGADLPDGPADEPDLFRDGAKSLVTMIAAMNVELQLAPEQVSDPRSPYAALERRVKDYRKALIEAVTEARGGTQGGDSDTGTDTASNFGVSGNFPDADDMMTRAF